MTTKFTAAFVITLLSTTATYAEHACTDCHSSAAATANNVVKPLSELCADCHQERIAVGEHQVDIPVSFTTNNTLPLQNGNLTCITCHDPHQPGLALRIKNSELCMQCHKR